MLPTHRASSTIRAVSSPPAKLLLAAPRGFCAGVERAIEVVERALATFAAPVYVYHEIVHNGHVVHELKARGAIFVDELDDSVPDGSVIVFSAHGVSPAVRRTALAKSLQVVDATCPLVTKVHVEAVRFAAAGSTILLVGHADHDEVVGTFGEAPDHIVIVQSRAEAQTVEVRDPTNVAVITQTTLSLDETRDILTVIRRRFPAARFPSSDDICYATQNRQRAVKNIAARSDLVLVVGSANSSNSMRLVEVARTFGAVSHLIDDVSQIDASWFDEARTVGITAGASAPESQVQKVVDYVRSLGPRRVETVEVVREDVRFGLPPQPAAPVNSPIPRRIDL